VFVVVSWLWHPVLKTINYAFSRLRHVEVNQAINKNTVGPVNPVQPVAEAVKLTPAMLTTVPTPTGLKAELMSGHAVQVTWNPVPGAVGYNAYVAYESLDFKIDNPHLLKSNGALWTPDTGRAVYRYCVTAVDAQGHESAYSDPLTLDMR